MKFIITKKQYIQGGRVHFRGIGKKGVQKAAKTTVLLLVYFFFFYKCEP